MVLVLFVYYFNPFSKDERGFCYYNKIYCSFKERRLNIVATKDCLKNLCTLKIKFRTGRYYGK